MRLLIRTNYNSLIVTQPIPAEDIAAAALALEGAVNLSGSNYDKKFELNPDPIEIHVVENADPRLPDVGADPKMELIKKLETDKSSLWSDRFRLEGEIKKLKAEIESLRDVPPVNAD